MFKFTFIIFLLMAGLSLAEDIPYIDVDGPSPPQGPTSEQIERLFGNPDRWEAFLEDLKSAVEGEDAQRLSSMMAWPLRVFGPDGEMLFESKEAFLKQFEEIFPESICKAIRGQEFDDLFVRDQGVMVGRGEIWFSAVYMDTNEDPFASGDYVIKVVTINLDGPAAPTSCSREI